MIERGPIYSSVLRDVLRTFSDDFTVPLGTTRSVGDWLVHGAFQVQSYSSKKIDIEASKSDFNSYAFGEIELLRNHCLEQFYEMACAFQDARPRSDAWQLVTTYYFGFFAAHQFLRLIGRPVLYLDKNRLSFLNKLAVIGVGSKSVTAGSFLLFESAQISATQSLYSLVRMERIHEDTWKEVFAYLKTKLSILSKGESSSESLLYSLISTKSVESVMGRMDWPSVVRTRANYRAGVAYRLIDKIAPARMKRNLERWSAQSNSKCVGFLAGSCISCLSGGELEIERAGKLMLDVCMSIFVFSNVIYKDLLERRRFDRRWESRRKSFVEENQHVMQSFGKLFTG